ncbi:uncharacterized protein LOC132729520 [Ruditapes philippinarum]|uniref:uncharacterized protein LOC132729520 n=1 Tax=Ruditapes philippinarum TaxID=129788 RepID=UPI00295BB489|nr:uncharacterized protein LOC132729520 [Ruditapes philippinarum]XP_060571279.1 uncharacterized protein LOC132729520 [Ruditapes philippinarum]
MMRLSVLTALFVPCLSLQETHHFLLTDDGKSIHQDVIYNQEDNTVLVIVGDVSMYKNTIPTINYHDYDTGYVVFKDIKHQMCSLSRVPIPKPPLEIYRQGVSNVTLRFTAKHDPTSLTYSEVKEKAGLKIAEFCKDYVTFYQTLIPKRKNKRSEKIAESPCHFICGFCVLDSDHPDPHKNNKDKINFG